MNGILLKYVRTGNKNKRYVESFVWSMHTKHEREKDCEKERKKEKRIIILLLQIQQEDKIAITDKQ